jgi:hypothetical protein
MTNSFTPKVHYLPWMLPSGVATFIGMLMVHLTVVFLMPSLDIVQQELRFLSTLSTNYIIIPIPFEEMFKIRSILSFAVLNSFFEVSIFLTKNK